MRERPAPPKEPLVQIKNLELVLKPRSICADEARLGAEAGMPERLRQERRDR